MNGGVWRVAWYRCRTTFRRRWGGYLSLVLLVGLVGGVAMGAVAAGRRTQSSFPVYWASTNPSTLDAFSAVLNPTIGSFSGYNAKVVSELRHIPHVSRVASASGLDVIQLARNGTPINVFSAAAGNGLGSVDGEGLSVDRLSVVQGHLPDPTRADEVAMQTEQAQATHVHLGEHLRFGVYTNAQTLLPAFGTARIKPYRVVDVTVTALVIQPSDVIHDDVDNTGYLALFTPALTRQLLACCSNYTETGLQVDGSRWVPEVTSAVHRITGAGFPDPADSSAIVAKAERALRPESLAIGVFGGIAAVAVLLIGAQVIARQTRVGAGELPAVRALGASPAMTSADGLVGILGAVVVGAALAVVVAVALSPLAPVGPVRVVYPTPGVAFDWTVLGTGFLVLVLVLGAAAVVFARRMAPHRAAVRRRRPEAPGAALAGTAGLPAPAQMGVRFALEPGAGTSAVPVRSAILGATLAVLVMVSTVTFGASLDTLVSHPRLYGWNWDYMLTGGGGSGDIPQALVTRLLQRDRYVASWSGSYIVDGTIDGQTVPILGERPSAAVQPPLLSGHGLQSSDQVVLGALTMSQLHKHLGDTVTMTEGGKPVRLVIVGTATMPTMGAYPIHLEMGSGALLDSSYIPPVGRNPFDDPQTGPENIFVNLRPGVDRRAALRSLNAMTGPLTNNFNFGVAVSPILHPAEIVNYRSMGTTPVVLGAALAAGALAALGLTLLASVRRRRRDLALMKTLGFTGRQLASIVAWQSGVAVVIGIIVGVPLGIVAGRALWNLFAADIHAVPDPTVPALLVSAIAVGSFLLALAVSAIPGRLAARTPTALLLRSE